MAAPIPARCQMDKLIKRRTARQRRAMAAPPDVPECWAPATRSVHAGSRRAYRVCLWHSLVATERMGARLLATTPT